MNQNIDGTLVILQKNWKRDEAHNRVVVRCPCCTTVTSYTGQLGDFTEALKTSLDTIALTTICECFESQSAYLDGFNEPQ